MAGDLHQEADTGADARWVRQEQLQKTAEREREEDHLDGHCRGTIPWNIAEDIIITINYLTYLMAWFTYPGQVAISLKGNMLPLKA